MSDELFSAAEARRVRPLPAFHPRCDQCGLYRNCSSPKMPVDGRGERGILLISDHPGPREDERGKPLVGGSGRWLQEELAEVGIDMRRDCWITNALICFPRDEYPATAVDDCRPNVLKAIRDLKPRVIVLLGALAIQSVIGHYWKSDVGPVTRWTGRLIPNHEPNAWIVPLNNPAHLVRDTSHPVEVKQFRETLVRIASITAAPWPSGPPDYRKRVECVMNAEEASAWLATIRSGTIAFDYETDRLKPHDADAEIVCCSVCYEGRTTKAFMWRGGAVAEMRRILSDPGISKIGWNLAFESEWTFAKLGVWVQGWKWDGMLAAHALDPRRGRGDDDRGAQTTGLKFQSYVTLGVGDYSGHLEDMLQPRDGGEGGNAPNSVRKIEPHNLLLYCGLDSLLEWDVSQVQMAEMEGLT